MRKYFGTDGIRGLANSPPMTVETALRLGRAVATVFSRDSHRARILVGKDTRLSGYMFEAALVAGVTSTGADVTLLGPLPTPGIAFLTTSMRADAGIVLSASHNPFHDNGLKVFARDGFKLPDAVELEIEALMDADPLTSLASGSELGRARRVEDATGRYVTHLKTMLRGEFDLEGITIVVDCANGAAYKAAPTLFRELGANVVELGTDPNGTNINDGCGSLHPELAAKKVVEVGAQLGVCLDGDADRIILIDETGAVVDGDAVMALCAVDMQARGTLHGDTLVATVMSNMGLERAVAPHGIRVERAQVGDRYVVERMRAGGWKFGGEQSGHLIFLDHATTGDGLVAAIEILNVMVARQRPLSELASIMKRYPQVLLNRGVKSKPPIDSLARVQRAIADAEAALAGDGRVLVRYSGTEPKVRVMLEGPDVDRIGGMAHSILAAFADDVGLAD
ncbi:MAG: phosphoglucosamine mutase [Myxococcales bacterium]|nr:phosphoglucosamine mutase [Myxococcales bacterium]MCB9531271.1 phosphoglucosamine mutase [Myxococcales bacterium]